MVALVLAGAVLIGATAQAIRAGVEGARAQRFLALRDAWNSDGTYHNPLCSTAAVVSTDGHVLEAKASGVPLDIFYEQALEWFGGVS